MGNSIFERKYEILMTEAVTVNSPSHKGLDDVGCNADLYMLLLNRARFKVVVIINDHNK